MLKQIELFTVPTPAHWYPIGKNWFIEVSKKSTAESQNLHFRCEGLRDSVWLINAIDHDVVFLSGDQEQAPSKKTVGQASAALIEMTKAGLLFPRPLNEVIYMNAWQKGFDAGFNDEPETRNTYPKGTIQYAGWIEGWFDSHK